MCIYIYIYIERERERYAAPAVVRAVGVLVESRGGAPPRPLLCLFSCVLLRVCIYVYAYIYIYIYTFICLYVYIIDR